MASANQHGPRANCNPTSSQRKGSSVTNVYVPAHEASGLHRKSPEHDGRKIRKLRAGGRAATPGGCPRPPPPLEDKHSSQRASPVAEEAVRARPALAQKTHPGLVGQACHRAGTSGPLFQSGGRTRGLGARPAPQECCPMRTTGFWSRLGSYWLGDPGQGAQLPRASLQRAFLICKLAPRVSSSLSLFGGKK